MKNINKIILAIILVSIILGGAIIISQIMEQTSIETQKEMDITLEEKKLEIEKIKQEKAEKEKLEFALLLDECIEDGEFIYWSYVANNGTDFGDGLYEASGFIWDEAEARKQSHNDVCFKKYK